MDMLVQTEALRPTPSSLLPGTRVTVNESKLTYVARGAAYELERAGLKVPSGPPEDLLVDTATASGFAAFATLPTYASLVRFQSKEAAAVDWSAAVEVTANTAAGAEEVSEIDFTGLADTDVADTYFLVSGATARYYVWFNVNAAGTDPAVAGATGVEVALATAADDDAIAAGVAAALDALADFVATATLAVVEITDAAKAFRTPIAAGDSGAVVSVTTRGVPVGTAQVAFTGLDADTDYEVRVRAEHEIFDTAWSETEAITTLAT